MYASLLSNQMCVLINMIQNNLCLQLCPPLCVSAVNALVVLGGSTISEPSFLAYAIHAIGTLAYCIYPSPSPLP